MTPDWIPNIHPFIIHFPVALIVTAIVVDIGRLIFQKYSWIEYTVLLLYVAGTIGLIAAYIAGQQAVDTVSITGAGVTTVAMHEDWALYTTLFFILFTILRSIAHWKNWMANGIVRSTTVLLAVAGGGMLWQTGDLGAQLVFRHGVAVGEIDRLQERIESLEQDLAGIRGEVAPVVHDDGSWSWRITPGVEQIIDNVFTITGSENFKVTTENDQDGSYLAVQPENNESFLLFGESMRAVEGIMELNIDGYNGTVKLLHYYRNPENYQYLKLENGLLSQGQVINGSDNVLVSGSVGPDNWFTLRVSASGEHFYGYMDNLTVTHSHANEMDPGMTGFSFYGNGELKIRRLEFHTL